MRFFIVLLFSLTFSFTWSQKKKCRSFLNGSFIYVDEKSQDWIVYRRDSLQIETNSKTGVEIHASIEWISDCKYVLTYIKVLNADDSLFIGKKINVEITDVKENFIKYRSVSNGIEIDGEMIYLFNSLKRVHTRKPKKQ
ncbi:MAG: hypothetical protein JNJ52_03090 [Flavobacterium sp.]|nr:hypothetical protein [Flavobacterium sp.]